MKQIPLKRVLCVGKFTKMEGLRGACSSASHVEGNKRGF